MRVSGFASVLAIGCALGCSSGSASRGVPVAIDEGHAVLPPEPPPAPPTESRHDGAFYEADPEGRPVPILRADAPNMGYAALDRTACEAELTRRAVPFVRAVDTPNVLAPVRLQGPLRGVSIHSVLSPAARAKSDSEILDCRLVLALDDFAGLVVQHGVVEIVHLSGYRPRSAHGCTPKYAGKQHCGALAVDVATFKRSDGTALVVERDFHGRIGLPTCAPGAGPNPPSAESTELWSLVCESARRAIFHVILTPNFNAEHKNHFHLEITPDAGWMLIK
jgi:hypothetical protein